MKWAGVYYILKGRQPVPVEDVLEWGQWFEWTEDRRIAEFRVNVESGFIRVSTVFLGIDHNFMEGKPLLFETMVFGGVHNEEQWRYSTYEEAEAGHLCAVELVLASLS